MFQRIYSAMGQRDKGHQTKRCYRIQRFLLLGGKVFEWISEEIDLFRPTLAYPRSVTNVEKFGALWLLSV